MIKNLFKKSIALADDEKAESDLALRLMFEIAISDGTLDSAELDIIKKRAQGSSNAELSVSSIVKKIIDETESSTSMYPTVKEINESYSKNEKLDLMMLLWELVAADNKIDPYEENLYFKIAGLIKIKRAEANQIKQQSA
jgi:uncharacterized tellurite resistance protein B-like protein